MKSIPSRPLRLNAIVAMGRNNEIGFKGAMPWHIPEDLQHFKKITLGHPVIMGRATWDSLPRRPLPRRLNIILSKNPGYNPGDFQDSDVKKAVSLEEAVDFCTEMPEPFVIGGGHIYKSSLPFVSRLYITRIEADFPEADTYFPEISPEEWVLAQQSETLTSSTGLSFRFETYERRTDK